MKAAFANYGWAVALVVAALALVLAWQAFNPVEEAADRVVAPVARSVGLLSGQCPGGWEDRSARDEHARVRSCERNGWLVILDQEGKFQHGFQLDKPGAVFVLNPALVPGWE